MNGHDPLLGQVGRTGGSSSHRRHMLDREYGGHLLGRNDEDDDEEDEDECDQGTGGYEDEWSKEWI